MDSFERNKIAGAILFALLVLFGVGSVADLLYAPEAADERAHIVEGAQVASAPQDAAATAAAAVPSLAMLLASASVEAGERAARKCVACHSFDEGGADKVGPNLWNIIAQPIAAKSGFSYSAAMTALGGNWDYERLDAFLQSPRKHVPGTKMNFAGVRKEQQRADIIAYMRSLSAAPPPLPEEESGQ